MEEDNKVRQREDMVENSRHILPVNDDSHEVARMERDVPPAHYSLKIESFSLLSQILEKSGVDKYESTDFEAGGYKWRLLLYPNGNRKRDAKDHISLYLAMSETNILPLGWEVNVIFKFLVYDQIMDKYLTIQDGRVRRFHALKSEWGIPRLLSLGTLNDPSNGYLIDDCCVFGAEVFVIKYEGKGETLSIINEIKNSTLTWKLEKFSEWKGDSYYSALFDVGGRQWKLMLYPNGDSWAKGKSSSLFLCLNDYSNLRPGWKLYVEFKLIIKDQVGDKDHQQEGSNWFCASATTRGYSNFISLRDLNDAKKGLIVNGTLIIEAKITRMSVVKYFS